MRHTHATLLLQEGVNIKAVAKRLGHASIQISLDTYAHVLQQIEQHAALSLHVMGLDTWPATVHAQVHFMRDDPFRDQAEIDGMGADVRAAGAPFELFEYAGAGHLFTDPPLPAELDGAATDPLWGRVLALLGELRGQAMRYTARQAR
jgi:hypothetical protein